MKLKKYFGADILYSRYVLENRVHGIIKLPVLGTQYSIHIFEFGLRNMKLDYWITNFPRTEF